jgi:hypothetical protein
LPQPIDRLETRGGHEPRERVLRLAVDGPLDERRGVRLLQGVLGEVEVAEECCVSTRARTSSAWKGLVT